MFTAYGNTMNGDLVAGCPVIGVACSVNTCQTQTPCLTQLEGSSSTH